MPAGVVKQLLKSIPGAKTVATSVRGRRSRFLRAVEDARFVGSRRDRARRIAAYLHENSRRRLQLGTGSNPLPGWLNTDIVDFRRMREVVYLDVTRPFPLPTGAFDLVYCEHMLEHLTYVEGRRCLEECRRVLRPGGRIRVATPSLDRLRRLYEEEKTELSERYIRWSIDTFVPEADGYLAGFVVNNMFRNWGHEFVYDAQTLTHILGRAGFVDLEEWPVGESSEADFVGIERHMRSAAEFNDFETMVYEGRRP